MQLDFPFSFAETILSISIDGRKFMIAKTESVDYKEKQIFIAIHLNHKNVTSSAEKDNI